MLVLAAPEVIRSLVTALLQRRDGSILAGTLTGELFRYDG
jgi:hypothetical protein